jgi:hypothetical protein
MGQALARAEGTLMLPGNERDVNILYKTATLEILGAETQAGRVVTDAAVHFLILYLDSEGRVQAIEAETTLNAAVEIENANSKMRPSVWGYIEGVNAVESGGRLSVRADIALEAQLIEEKTLQTVANVEEAGSVARRDARTVALTRAGGGRQRVLLSESFPLAQEEGARVLFTGAKATVGNAVIGAGSVTLDGNVRVEVAMASAAAPYYVKEFSLPFSMNVEVPGARYGMDLLTSAETRELIAEAVQGESENSLRIECILQAGAEAFSQTEYSALEDIFSADNRIIEAKNAEQEFVGGIRAFSQSLNLNHPIEIPGFRGSVLAVLARPIATSFEIEGGELVSEGIIEATVLYGDGFGVSAHAEEIPFRYTFPNIDWGGAYALGVYSAQGILMGGDRVELQLGLQLNFTQLESSRLSFVEDVQEGEGSFSRAAGVLLYYPAQDEDIWQVAKRFHLQPDELQGLNGGEEGPLVIYNKATEF